MTQEQIVRILTKEWRYWRDAEFENESVELMAMGAMGALSNVIAAVCLNLPQLVDHMNEPDVVSAVDESRVFVDIMETPAAESREAKNDEPA